MKRILVYTFAAVFLGILIALAPFAFYANEVDIADMNEQTQRASPFNPKFFQETSSKTEKLYVIPPATYPSEILFIAFMLILSLIIALGVRRYFMRNTTF